MSNSDFATAQRGAREARTRGSDRAAAAPAGGANRTR